MLLTHDTYSSVKQSHHSMSQTSRHDAGWIQPSPSEEFSVNDASLTSFSIDALISSVVEVHNSSNALHQSSISLLSRFSASFSAISDLPESNLNDSVSRLRGEMQSLQSKVRRSSDDMPVNDLIKCLEQLLEVEQELEESTKPEPPSSDDSSCGCSFQDDEDFDFEEQLNKTRNVHPMHALVSPQERQDSPPTTPRIGSKKLPSRVAETLPPKLQGESPRSRRSGGRKPRPTYAYVDNTGRVTKLHVDNDDNKLTAASDHAPLRPRLDSTGMSTRWSRSCGSNIAKKKCKSLESTSASDALKFNVKLDRANYRRRRFLKMMGDDFGLAHSQH